jgi:hypothetical protein
VNQARFASRERSRKVVGIGKCALQVTGRRMGWVIEKGTYIPIKYDNESKLHNISIRGL